MATIDRDVKYLNRDFSSIRTKLIEFSKTYFPNSYNDFSPSSPGMMFMEMSSYVGDVMSFYLDNQVQETYTQFARQTNNLYELAYMFGYKPKSTTSSQVEIELFQQIPAKYSAGQYQPDFRYSLVIEPNLQISSPDQTSISFLLEDKVDFTQSSSSDPTQISTYLQAGGIPQYFLLKKQAKSISATVNTETFTFTEPIPFNTINIEGGDIIGILDIKDSDGNIWYEVDYLAQEMIYDSIKNTNPNDPNNVANEGEVPYLLQLKKIQRRFATRLTSETNLQIQFGAGNPLDYDEVIIPNPNNVGLGLPFEKDKLTTAYSPTNFLFTNTYGISPSDTTLTVRYLTGGGVSSNVKSNSLSRIKNKDSNCKFSSNNLSPSLATYIYDSLIVNNPTAADGGQSGDTPEEIRQKTISNISSQQRSVTLDDYIIKSLSMPSRYGTISKAYIEKPKLTDDQVSTIETLNLWVLSQNSQNQFITASPTLKKNLRTYLSQYRVIGDNIEIRDAFIINIAIDFEIVVLPNYNNNEVLLRCIDLLKEYFQRDKWQFNQPIFYKDLLVKVDNVLGVQTVNSILCYNKSGELNNYSKYSYDIDGATNKSVIYPSLDMSIFEVKFPDDDIKGKVVPL
jgi:hypothetical protein